MTAYIGFQCHVKQETKIQYFIYFYIPSLHPNLCIGFHPASNLHLWLQIVVCMQQQPYFGKLLQQVWVANRSKLFIIWGLSALSYVKTDFQQSGCMRSPPDSTVMNLVSESAVESIRSWAWHVEVLVIYCILKVSGCNDFLCYWIKSPLAKRVELSQCNDFPILNSSPTGLFW